MSKVYEVLVVDDQAALRKVVIRILQSKKLPLQITEAESGAEALRHAHGRSFDLIVLDVKMPGEHDGFEVLKRVRQGGPNQETPIVMLTAEDKNEDIMEGLHGGATSYLTKPFDSDDLWEALQPYLSEPKPSKKILLVDDEEGIRKILRRALRDSAYTLEIHEAGDGQEALEVVDESFHALIMDVNMPRMTGLETLQELQKKPYFGDLKVIMLTGESAPQDILMGRNGGATTYLTKPFQACDVVLVVDYHLSDN